MNEELILDAIMNIGEGILVSGGEIFRVEDSIHRMLSAYDIERVDVFSITSAITVTIHTKDGKIFTNTRRVGQNNVNLNRLDMLNSLSRYICKNRPGPDYIFEKHKQIMACREYPLIIKNIAYATVSFSFCRIYGGNFSECIISSILGIVLINLVDFFKKTEINHFISLIGASYISGISGRLFSALFLLDPSKIAIGNIMLLLPGLTITNSLRDLITGDLMAGILHLCDGLLIATCLASGFALAQI